jgi:membrane-bound lytic murein transglycosylase D
MLNMTMSFYKICTFFLFFLALVQSFQTHAMSTADIIQYFMRQKNVEIFAQQQVDEVRAQRWYQFYLTKGKSTLERQLQRAQSARPIIENILREMKVPEDLFFIAVVESGFVSDAKSSKGAVGPWQFMPATGIRYGLAVEEKLDERKHLHKSTRAAAQYLKDLFHIFNDWNLAAAAYNAGEYRVLNAIRAGKTRSYKELCLGGFLPEETRDYLAKIWVVKALSERAEEFKINVPKNKMNENGDDWRQVIFDRPFPISTMAFILDRNPREVSAWNEDFQGAMIPGASNRNYQFYMPLDDYKRWQSLIGRPFVTKVKDPAPLSNLGIAGLSPGDSVQMIIGLEGVTKIHNLSTGESHTIKLP